MSASKGKKKPVAQPAANNAAKTRFRFKYTFDMEVDGLHGLPKWACEGYMRFIVAGLQGLGVKLPMTIVQPSSCEVRILEPNAKERAGRMVCVGGKWSDDKSGKRLILTGKKLVLVDAEGKVIP